MTIAPEIREQCYIYFLTEAPELLQLIKQGIWELSSGYSPAKVHNILRSIHTLKGGATNLELELIQQVAHALESVFQVLYYSQIVRDCELNKLLVPAYEWLQMSFLLEISNSTINHELFIQDAINYFADLQAKLEKYSSGDLPISLAHKFGFDIVQSLFKRGVGQRLESIKTAIKTHENTGEFTEFFHSQTEIFLALAESCNLSGFAAIAKTTIAALKANPSQAVKIAEIALIDFQQGRQAILAGDRTCGGKPSLALQKFTNSCYQNFVISNTSLPDSLRVPLTNALNNFPQMVQKLGKAYGKVVELKLTGTQVLVEPVIAQKLYNPLLQLTLNAFAHGIELPEGRRHQGKANSGVIEISACYQENFLIIQVRDDGKGLDLAKIRRRAREMNLIPDSPLNDHSLIDVLFTPGFSTSATVSEICGCGMGLDIVRSQLLALNGSVTVQSTPLQGTTFLLKLPVRCR
jgi:chemotaxis family two-component system sensor histidine kinase/response regulator PixL